MTSVDSPLGGRLPSQESLFRAAAQLEEAIEEPSATPAWYQTVHAAIRSCVLAIEYHLDSLLGPEGIGHEVREREPRLLPDLERLEAQLARALIDAWEAKATAPAVAPAFIDRLRALIVEVRAAAGHEFDLVHETFRPTPGED
ncbi:MAG: hypothetical protein Kow0010_04620 [Dehalococcoidia bacterium]